ncbi:MAG: Calx-beta domain [Frankiales bacterium]|jgi:hypothetical protein|nr:Calx-beta domain [Frankiales bacterium]
MSRKLIRSRLRRTVLLVAVAGVAIVVRAPAAFAHCHAFTISASPSTVNEGGNVTVTVKRDGHVADSQVDARTVNGTATSGQDFTGGMRTVKFTGSQTSKSFTVPTINDSKAEGTETFQVELVQGSAQGCTGSGYVYGPPKTVTIARNDQPTATKSPTPPPHHTSPPTSPGGGTTNGTSPSATASGTPAPTTPPAGATTPPTGATTTAPGVVAEPSPTIDGGLADSPSNDSGGGASTGLVVLAAVLLAALFAGGGVYLRRRGTHL